MKKLGIFMDQTFDGRLNEEKVARIRDLWPGKLVIKGIAGISDAHKAISLGADGIIVSNHGGRQLDAGVSSIRSLENIVKSCQGKIKIMMDSGLRSGPDIARTLATGAAFTFLGRSFMYGVAALGNQGGDHSITILKTQLRQIMNQLCCEHVNDLQYHLVRSEKKNTPRQSGDHFEKTVGY